MVHPVKSEIKYILWRLHLIYIWPNEPASTKRCNLCGNSNMLLLRSYKQKVCTGCRGNKGKANIIPWDLNTNQSPLL